MTEQRSFQLDSDEYPFQDHWMEYQNSALHYLDEPCRYTADDGSEEIAVLMLHGNPTWSFLYRRVIAANEGRQRCIAPDYPGFGFSGHPPGYRYTPQEHAEAVLALIEHLQLKRFILIIQDWGGPIGIEVATRFPEKIAGLVIGNTWSWRPDALLTVFSKILGGPVGKYLILQHNLFAGYFMQGALEQLEKQPQSLLDAYSKPFPTPVSREGTWVFPRAISGEGDWLDGLEKKLPLLADKPIELVWGMKDPLMARDKIINRWRRHFPKAGFTSVESAGHFLQETAPLELNQAVQRIVTKNQL